MEENDCNPIPMAEWVQQDDPKNCRPCIVAPVVRWYRDHLEEKGQTDPVIVNNPYLKAHLAHIVQAIEQLAETADVLTLCQELDKIKEAVDPSTRERLKVFDCAVQSYASQTPSEQKVTTEKEANSG